VGLTKREYTDKETLITAKNMNDIQDAVIATEGAVWNLIDEIELTVDSGNITVETDKEGNAFSYDEIMFVGYGKGTSDGNIVLQPNPANPELNITLTSILSKGTDNAMAGNLRMLGNICIVDYRSQNTAAQLKAIDMATYPMGKFTYVKFADAAFASGYHMKVFGRNYL
jgi:hypothetical protein